MAGQSLQIVPESVWGWTPDGIMHIQYPSKAELQHPPTRPIGPLLLLSDNQRGSYMILS